MRTLGQFKRGRIWLLLLVYFFIHWLILLAHYKFYSPIFYGVISFWTNLIDSQNAAGFTHYPGHFAVMPYFFGWAKFAVSVLLEGSVLGAISIWFYRVSAAGDYPQPPGFRQLAFLWFQLTLSWLAINGLIMIANLFMPDLLAPLLANSPRRIMAFQYLFMPFIYVCILALFYFSISYCALYRTNVLVGLKNSLLIFRGSPLMSLFLAAVILAVPVIISIIGQQQTIIINKFRPELIYWILVAGLLADAIVYFFWMGTAVRVLTDRE